MRVLAIFGGVSTGIVVGAWLAMRQRRGAVQERRTKLNINEASQQEIMQVLGLDAATAERIVEHRPYPSKLDMLGRMVVPEDVYLSIKNRISYKAS